MAGETYHRLGTQGELNLFAPGTAQTGDDVRLRDVLYVELVVVLGIILEDDALDAIRGAAEPARLDVMQDRLELGLRTRNVRHLADADAQAASQYSTEVSGRVGQAVGLAAAVLERNEDAEVVLAGQDANARAGELGGDLIEATGREAALGTADVKGAHGRVVRGLLGEVGDADGLVVRGQGDMLRNGEGDGGGVFVALGGLEAGGAASGSASGLEGRGVDLGRVVLRFPVTLPPSSASRVTHHISRRVSSKGHAHPEELSQARVVWFARLALGVFQVLGEPEAANLQHAVEGLIGGSDGDESVGRVEIIPVFEVRRGLEELGGKREAHGCEVSDADEPGCERQRSAQILISTCPFVARVPGDDAIYPSEIVTRQAMTTRPRSPYRISAPYAFPSPPSCVWRVRSTDRQTANEAITHFFRMPINVFSLDPSLWGSSGASWAAVEAMVVGFG